VILQPPMLVGVNGACAQLPVGASCSLRKAARAHGKKPKHRLYTNIHTIHLTKTNFIHATIECCP
jgi:hypothetical protein